MTPALRSLAVLMAFLRAFSVAFSPVALAFSRTFSLPFALAALLAAAALPTRAANAQSPVDSAPAAATLERRSVMTGQQVIDILDQTVAWYRMLGLQQQSSTQPSDLLILYANRQTAEKAVNLAFELARANAELLSSEAELDHK